MTAGELCSFLDGIAPFSAQCGWDNSGFLTGDENAEVTGIVTALDVTPCEIETAIREGANTIVAHHPVIFHPLKSLKAGDPVFEAVKAGINIICAHTNLDKAKGGVNDSFCELIGMTYEKCPEDVAEGCLNTGTIPVVNTPEELASYLKEKLGCSVRYVPAGEKITRIGVCTGSGAEFAEDAKHNGCEALITGDASYHAFLDAAAMGVSLFAAGHFETEVHIAQVLAERIKKAFPDVKVTVSERKNPVITV